MLSLVHSGRPGSGGDPTSLHKLFGHVRKPHTKFQLDRTTRRRDTPELSLPKPKLSLAKPIYWQVHSGGPGSGSETASLHKPLGPVRKHQKKIGADRSSPDRGTTAQKPKPKLSLASQTDKVARIAPFVLPFKLVQSGRSTAHSAPLDMSTPNLSLPGAWRPSPSFWGSA